MPRRRREFVPGGYYHVIQRGVNRRKIFTQPGDQERFLEGLQGLVERFGHRVHAYCLMPNHVHLALQCGELPLGNALRSLFGRYAQVYNRQNKRSGHLFQERHKAILIGSDAYLVELVRYIHLNPVRARLVRRVEQWPWSSYRAYVGKQPAPSWLTTQTVLGTFSDRRGRAQVAFCEFVAAGQKSTSDLDFKRGNSQAYDALAPDGYLTKILAKGDRRTAKRRDWRKTVAAVCAYVGVKPADLEKPGRARKPALARGALAYMARQGADWRIKDLVEQFNRDQAVLSLAATMFERRLAENKALRRWFESL